MTEGCVLYIVVLLINIEMFVKTHGVFNLRLGGLVTPSAVIPSTDSSLGHLCFINNKWDDCHLSPQYNVYNSNTGEVRNRFWQIYYKKPQSDIPNRNSGSNSMLSTQPMSRSLPLITKPPGLLNLLPIQGHWPTTTYPSQNFRTSNTYNTHSPQPDNILPSIGRSFNLKLTGDIDKPNIMHRNTQTVSTLPSKIKTSTTGFNNLKKIEDTTKVSHKIESSTIALDEVETEPNYNISLVQEFLQRLDRFERTFYLTTFKKLSCISPEDRRENGMSFVESGLFLQMTLLALSTEVDANTRAEIEQSIGFIHNETEKVEIIRHLIQSLPNSTEDLKFRRSSRLVLWPGRTVSAGFYAGAAKALGLRVDTFNGTETPDIIAAKLNHMVELDSGGAIRDTFDESELSEGVDAVLVTTLYLRTRWRSAPTLLNGTHPFQDSESAPKRTIRMIRINDIIKYAHLREWDAEVLEISYSSPGLSLLMFVPQGHSLKSLSEHVANVPSLSDIVDRTRPIRVAATVPLYTLRMTLLLRNKLQAMGITRLLNSTDETSHNALRLSHAVQRIMFWAEAGRNAFKDDGLDWDEPPELSVLVDRPYIFFVRWRNITLMNGHFVL